MFYYYKVYSQKYKRKWAKEQIFSGWLKEDKSDPKRALCSCCQKVMKAKRSVLKLHAESQSHKYKVKQLHDPNIRTLEDVNCTPMILERQVKEGELKLAAFIVEHNLSFSTMDHLSDLLAGICPDSKVAAGIKCKRTKTTGIVKNIMGPQLHSNLVSILRASCFSLLIDESTDVSAVKQLCLVVRYFDNSVNKVVSKHYALIDVPQADAATLFDKIEYQFNADRIPITNVIGFASDGASVMVGEHNSVKSRLLQVNPNLFVTNCICHSAHLVASYACAKLPRQTEDFVRGVYSYFSHSAKRLHEFKQFQQFTETKPHKLLRPCQTRWLFLQQCVHRIVEQWNALLSYFAHVSQTERLLQAERIHSCLSNGHFKLFFYFLDFILPKFTNFNKLYQSQTPNLHVLHKNVQMLYKELLSYYIQPTYLRTSNLADIDPAAETSMLQLNQMYLGVNVAQELIKPFILANRPLVENFLVRCRDFYVTAAKEIRKRFPIHDSTIRHLEVLSPTCSHAEFSSLGQLIQRFPNLVEGVNAQTLDDEWRRLSLVDIPFSYNEMPVDEYWGRISAITDGTEALQFPVVAKFMKQLLVLPHSNADTERIFSQINLIKSKVRNKLTTETVNSLLSTKDAIENCTKFIPSNEMVKSMDSATIYHNLQVIDQDED